MQQKKEHMKQNKMAINVNKRKEIWNDSNTIDTNKGLIMIMTMTT